MTRGTVSDVWPVTANHASSDLESSPLLPTHLRIAQATLASQLEHELDRGYRMSEGVETRLNSAFSTFTSDFGLGVATPSLLQI